MHTPAIRIHPFCLDERGVEGEFGGLETSRLVEFVEDDSPNPDPDAGAGPVEVASPEGDAGRKVRDDIEGPPAAAVAEDEDDTLKAGAVYRARSLPGKYWNAQGWQALDSGQQITAYVFQVPKGKNVITIESAVRDALAKGGNKQKLSMDFTGGTASWIDRGNVRPALANSALDQTQLRQGSTVLANSAADGARIEVQLGRDDLNEVLPTLAPGGKNYVYILEAPTAPDGYKILKVGRTGPGIQDGNSPLDRATKPTSNALSYKSMAWDQYPLVWHLFPQDKLPEQFRNITNAEFKTVEQLLREELYAKGYWLPEDRTPGGWRTNNNDPVKSVHGRQAVGNSSKPPSGPIIPGLN